MKPIYLSIPARTLVPLLQPLTVDDPLPEKARTVLLQWDYRLTKESAAAGIYNAWERILFRKMEEMVVPEQARPYYNLQMKQLIDWLLMPDDKFGAEPVKDRNTFLLNTLEEAVTGLKDKFGKEMQNWNLGQLNYKHVLIKHPLSNAVDAPMREKLDVGPLPRGGNSYTVNNTSGNDNQTHGATFRIIIDAGNWDHSVATNSPGQAGDPEDKHYRNLFDIWAQDQYFPLFFTREKIESVQDEVILLSPQF